MLQGHRVLTAGTYFGKAEGRKATAGIGFSEWSYAPGAHLQKHAHPLSGFCVVLEGSYREAFASRTRECQTGDLVFHPPGEVHSDQHLDCVVRLLCVELSSERGDALRDGGHLLDEPTEFRNGEPTWLAARLAREFRNGDFSSELALEGLALELVALTSRDSRRTTRDAPSWLRRAVEFLREGRTQGLDMEGIARQVGVHPVHLARTFRRHYGCTPADFVRGLKVDDARRRLATTQDPLGTIALDAGFSDQSHFSRVFREKTGFSPAEYRRSLNPLTG